MNVLFVLLLLAGLAALVLVAVRRPARGRRSPAGSPADPLRRDTPGGVDPRRLQVGDVVHYGGLDFIVRGSLELEEGGFRWQEHFLDDVETRRWLSVEDDEQLELCMWQSVSAPELTPGAHRVEYQGVVYSLDERGRASYRATGTTGTAPAGQMEYVDYAAGDRRLTFERYGDVSWEVALGEVVPEYALDIYPRSA